MTNLLGLSGKLRSGKDTAVAYLVQHYGFHRIAFADKLKEAARVVFGFSEAQLYGDLKEVVDPYWSLTPRDVLQRMGTESMRDVFGPNIWVNALFRDQHDRLTALSDVRFMSEVDAVQGRGGKVIRLLRNPHPHKRTTWQRLTGRNRLHRSEAELDRFDGWDFVIDNRESLDQLHRGLDHAMEALGIAHR